MTDTTINADDYAAPPRVPRPAVDKTADNRPIYGPPSPASVSAEWVDEQMRRVVQILGELIGRERARGDQRMEELDAGVIQFVQDWVAEVADRMNEIIDRVNELAGEVAEAIEGDGDGGDGDDVLHDPVAEGERYRAWVTFEAARVGVGVSELAKVKRALGGEWE